MEIWQHLLALLISISGLFVGRLITKHTHSEVDHAKKWIEGAGILLTLSGVLLSFFVLGLDVLWYFFTTLIFAGFAYKTVLTVDLKHRNLSVVTFGMYAVFGAGYTIVALSSYVLLFVTLMFLGGLCNGSLTALDLSSRKKKR